MKSYGVFDIIGPRMIGPSSSHTAGAARLGLVACRLAGGVVKKASVTLYGSFATTGPGHGTDKAIAGGLLGFGPDDARLRDSFALARQAGREFSFEFSDAPAPHPNSARIAVTNERGETAEMLGASVGGGNIEVLEIDGMELSFSCAYPTMLVFHRDMPGEIGRVTSVLARAGINIAFMRVFRTSRRQDACMVLETDEPLTPGMADAVRRCSAEIRRVCVL